MFCVPMHVCTRKIGFKYDIYEGVRVSWLIIACDMRGLCLLHATHV